MFDISSCSQCGKAVTQDNKSEFIEMNGRIFCRDCVNKSTPITTSLSAFQTLRSTQIIKKLSDGKYNNAHTIAEKIDVFEKSLKKTSTGSFFKLLLILAVLGGLGYGGFYVYEHYLFKPGTNTGEPVKDPGKKNPPAVTETGNGKTEDPDVKNPETPEGPDASTEDPATAKADPEAELKKLKDNFEATLDLFQTRKDILEAMKKSDYKGFSDFLSVIDGKIAASAESDLENITKEVKDSIAEQKYSEALKLPDRLKARFSGTAWIESDVTKKKLAALAVMVNDSWKNGTEKLLSEAGELEKQEKYLEAYALYKKIITDPFPGLREKAENNMKALITKTSAHFGEKGIEEHLKWRKYVIFRTKFCEHLKRREFSEARDYASELAMNQEFAPVENKIREDRKDVDLVERVLALVSENLKAFAGKDYTLRTQAGKVKGTITAVDNGIVTIETLGVPVSIAINKLTSDEFNNIIGNEDKDKGALNIGLGILFLADGNVEQAKVEFNLAAKEGKDISRYLDQIRAYEDSQKEKKAAQAFKTLKFLLVKKKMG